MITIVTDSSSYFKKDEARELGIKIISIGYVVNQQIYFESYSDQNGDFEDLIKSNSNYYTSQPNISTFLSCFNEELAKDNDILCITISSHLSGTFNSAHLAAKQIGSGNIAVFDSHLTAGGLYLLIKEAKKLVKSGLTLSQVIIALPEIIDKISIAFTVDDMAPLRKSGRIGFVRMSVETILNIKPILILKEGTVISSGIARGDTDIIKKLTEKVTDDVKELVVNYIGNSRLATNLYSVLKDIYPAIPISLHKAGPILGIHLGLGMVSISFISL